MNDRRVYSIGIMLHVFCFNTLIITIACIWNIQSVHIQILLLFHKYMYIFIIQRMNVFDIKMALYATDMTTTALM